MNIEYELNDTNVYQDSVYFKISSVHKLVKYKPVTLHKIANRCTTLYGIPIIKPTSFSYAPNAPYYLYAKVIIATTKLQHFSLSI